MTFAACPNCGKQMNVRARRCKYCGWQRPGGTSPASAPEQASLASIAARWLGLTLVGLLAGSVGGYIVGATIGMILVGVLVGLNVLQSETGGWTESNIIDAILWLMAVGAVVGVCQSLALPGRPRWGWWWVLASALVWGLVAIASLTGEGRLRAVALIVAFPLAVLFSLVGGAAALVIAMARYRASH